MGADENLKPEAQLWSRTTLQSWAALAPAANLAHPGPGKAMAGHLLRGSRIHNKDMAYDTSRRGSMCKYASPPLPEASLCKT